MADLKLQQSRLDGRYDILECLGRGSYAEIYVATDNAAAEAEKTAADAEKASAAAENASTEKAAAEKAAIAAKKAA